MSTKMSTSHAHAVATSGGPLPYVGGVAGRHGVTCRAAHGGERRVETCACGATREALYNGPFSEHGQWWPGPSPAEVRASRP